MGTASFNICSNNSFFLARSRSYDRFKLSLFFISQPVKIRKRDARRIRRSRSSRKGLAPRLCGANPIPSPLTLTGWHRRPAATLLAIQDRQGEICTCNHLHHPGTNRRHRHRHPSASSSPVEPESISLMALCISQLDRDLIYCPTRSKAQRV